MTKEDLFRKNHLLGIEFDRYILEHPELLDSIPDGAEIIFLPENDEDLCRENLKIAETHKKSGINVVFIKIEKLAPPKSRLINVRIEKEL